MCAEEIMGQSSSYQVSLFDWTIKLLLDSTVPLMINKYWWMDHKSFTKCSRWHESARAADHLLSPSGATGANVGRRGCRGWRQNPRPWPSGDPIKTPVLLEGLSENHSVLMMIAWWWNNHPLLHKFTNSTLFVLCLLQYISGHPYFKVHTFSHCSCSSWLRWNAFRDV